MITAGDVIDAVRASGFEADQDGRSFVFINVIQRKVIGDHRWRFLRATASSPVVAGTASYALPDDLMHLMSVRLTTPGSPDQPDLTWVDDDRLLWLASVDPTVQQYYYPTFWSDTTPGTVQLHPAPYAPGTLTIRYLRRVSDITLESDVPDIPNEYLDVLRAGICWQLAQRESSDRAAGFKTEFGEILAAMKGQYGLRQTQSAHRVVDSGRYPAGDGWRSVVGWGH